MNVTRRMPAAATALVAGASTACHNSSEVKKKLACSSV
jgi:hypothetical protein